MKISVAQAPSSSADLTANVRTAKRLIEMAGAEGADVVVLPELFLCGYDIEAIAVDPERYAVSLDDAVCDELRQSCENHDVMAIVGAAVRSDGAFYNSALLVPDDGRGMAVFHKVNLWTDEARVFTAGRTGLVVQTGSVNLGLAICYDAGFPEYVRELVHNGADVIVCPCAFSVPQRRRYELYMPIRALENTVYALASNAVGIQGGEEMFGGSIACDPYGEEIGRVTEETALINIEIDRVCLNRARQDLPYLEKLREMPRDVQSLDWRKTNGV